MSTKRKRALAVAAVVAALGGGGAAIAMATGGGDDDGRERAITGSALQRASDAALEHTGGGEVTETEAGDEESYYEVEVRTDEGQTDVQLDRDFNVVDSEGDSDEREDED